MKTVCTCLLSLSKPSSGVFDKDSHQRAVANGFFIALIASVLHTIARLQPEGVEEKGYTVCRKTRGQFPNNPWGWSNQQARGRWQHPMLMPQGGENTYPPTLIVLLGVGGSLGENHW